MPVPLVCIPAMLADASLFDAQKDGLHGLADLLPLEPVAARSLEEMADAVIDQLSTPAVVMGVSMGAAVALEVALRAPEKVLGLVYVAMTAAAVSDRGQGEALITRVNAGDFSGAVADLLPLLVAPDRIGDEPLTRQIVRMANAVGPDRGVLQEMALLERPNRLDHCPQIRVPVLAVAGERDAIVRAAEVNATAARFPYARFEVLTACGHLPPIECPLAFNDLLRSWLARYAL
jgi:pimeloyl-ACP methyl ester carboxylesterase